MQITLIKKRAGCRYRYYPACTASKWLCKYLKRTSLPLPLLEGIKRHLGVKIVVNEKK